MSTGLSGTGNRHAARFFKIAVSVTLLALLFYTLDISRIVDNVREARWWAILLAVATLVPEPHLWEKLKMLAAGTLIKPIDIFDLFQHATPLVLLLIKLYRSQLSS